MDDLYLKIVTPSRTFYDGEVEKIVFRSIEGDIAILKNHIPMMTLSGDGILAIYEKDKKVIKAALFGGSVMCESNHITILTSRACYPEDVDIKRADEALDRAKNRLKDPDADIKRAQSAMNRALIRKDVASNVTVKIKNK